MGDSERAYEIAAARFDYLTEDDVDRIAIALDEYAIEVARDAEAKLRAEYDSKYAELVKAAEEVRDNYSSCNNCLPKPECEECVWGPFNTALAALKECHDNATTEG